jgi:adenylosuccinate lyase
MLKNLDITRGLVFSGQLLLALTQKGISREDAYSWTQRNAMKVWDEGGNYQELIKSDADISSHLSREEIDSKGSSISSTIYRPCFRSREA